ncbi:UDP-GalNAc:beta-1,3-N-acetylgalactosaminyltransferase 1-like isoform X2 [Latimeria chalumnae]|nr:PREDICTED: UDP-GalNAc:beta-1,3-N-acetylgalactosaminyltransferase 1-like isoform X2 [Latimeria chalumnae]|eukprot:XP_014346560.1 PREDICTED: UDP-GalNAc:beta-1,3-N-acetylgalactosaminyltransferase 1-like isoform X2 [Latimeria chalumnae]
MISPYFLNKKCFSLHYLKKNTLFLVLVCGSFVVLVWCTIQAFMFPKRPNNWKYFYKHEPVYQHNFTFVINEQLKCQNNPPFLVILVTSHPSNTKARQAIRQTWGSSKTWKNQNIEMLFLLGREDGTEASSKNPSIEDESSTYGDILQEDFLDTYNNLTLKTIMAFRWIAEFCPAAQYVMKTDTDVFINPRNLVDYLLDMNVSETLFTGYPFMNNIPHRGFPMWYKKMYISYEEYPFSVYPPYCSGLGYVLSGKLALQIYQLTAHVQPIRFEDAYVGICLKLLGAQVQIPQQDYLFNIFKVAFDVCKYRKVIAVHGVDPGEMITYWRSLQEKHLLEC